MKRGRRPFRERLYPQWLWRLPPGRGTIALTFDDGPHPDTTPLLLDTLDRLCIKATLFVTGSRCHAQADIIRDASRRGHCLGNHGYCHVNLRYRTAQYQKESILSTQRVFDELGLAGSRLFRPPFGGFNWMTPRVLRRTNHQGVLWSVIGEDWVEQTADRLWKKLESQLHDGAVVVLHDGHPTTAIMIRVLPWLAEWVANRNWAFSLLSSGSMVSEP